MMHDSLRHSQGLGQVPGGGLMTSLDITAAAGALAADGLSPSSPVFMPFGNGSPVDEVRARPFPSIPW